MKLTSETARRILDENKSNTLWFTDGITFSDMYYMLRNRMQFGKAETLCIIASLKLNGAKIKQDKNEICEILKVKTEYQGVTIPDYTDTWSAEDDVQVICETFDDIETALKDEEII